MPNTNKPGGVQSVHRAFALLELLGDHGTLSLTELTTAIDLPAPTTHRLLKTLITLGYARQLPNRRYGLGLGLVRLASHVDTQFAPIARPHLEALAQQTGESANLAILDGDMVVYVAQAPSTHAMRMFTEVGHRAHSHSTGVGKAILSTLTDDQIDHILDRTGLPAATSRTITNPAKLHTELSRIRRQGYAIDNGEQEDGVRCYAVPIPHLPLPMAISVSGPAFRMTRELGHVTIPLLQTEAANLTTDLLGPASS